MSFEDTASHIYFDKAGRHVTSDKGFRMTRANVAVREGRWYWECKITRGILRVQKPGDPDSHGHVRIGWARREASLDAPVGFDAYSYGIRDVQGQKVHMSRPKDFFPPGESIKEGDVIGLEIQLPSESLHRKVVTGQFNPAVDLLEEVESEKSIEAPNIIRDRVPIRFKSNIYFERMDYAPTKELEDLMNPSPMAPGSGPSSEAPNPNHALPALRTLPKSHIKIYKNGKLMGTPWTNLLAFLPPASKIQQQQQGQNTNAGREFLDDGSLGYSPAVSVFRGGAVEVNFGPDFWYPPPGMEGGEEKVNEGDANPDGDILMEDADVTEEPEQQASDVKKDKGTAKVSLPDQKEPELRPVFERYDEQIVEDIVYDIIDEVGFWMSDASKVKDRTGKGEKGAAGLLPGGREEIKELVQDD